MNEIIDCISFAYKMRTDYMKIIFVLFFIVCHLLKAMYQNLQTVGLANRRCVEELDRAG